MSWIRLRKTVQGSVSTGLMLRTLDLESSTGFSCQPEDSYEHRHSSKDAFQYTPCISNSPISQNIFLIYILELQYLGYDTNLAYWTNDDGIYSRWGQDNEIYAAPSSNRVHTV